MYKLKTCKCVQHTTLTSSITPILQVTDPIAASTTWPMVDLSHLKYKERDDMETVRHIHPSLLRHSHHSLLLRVFSPLKVLKGWRKNTIDIGVSWEARLRAHYKSRYDSRPNLADWDHAMHLAPLAPNVAQREFVQWRLHGVIFRPHPDAPYDATNTTLLSTRSNVSVTMGAMETPAYCC